MNFVEVINNITGFSSSIWQVHPRNENEFLVKNKLVFSN